MLSKRPDQVKPVPLRLQTENVPPGQFVTKKFPVLTYGAAPKIELRSWRLRVFGQVEETLELDWEAFCNLPWSVVESDFHCVTQWSVLDNGWEGVLFSDLMNLVKVGPEARHVMAHSYGGYSTNVPLEVLLEVGALLAHRHNGEELGREHGWPVRLVVPQRYGWKSAKWLHSLELMGEDRPGFWELRGYHLNADPWREERFWPELTG